MRRNLILLTVALVSIVNYGDIALKAFTPALTASALDQHNAILDGTIGSPFTHRVLVPWLLAPFMHDGGSLVTAYAVADCLALLVFLLALDYWLRQWVTADAALIGVELTALLLPMMFRWFAIATSTPVEAALFTLGLICLKRLYDVSTVS